MFFQLTFSPKRRSLGTLPAEHIILLLCVQLITTGLRKAEEEEDGLHLQLEAGGSQQQVSARQARRRALCTHDGGAKDTFAQGASAAAAVIVLFRRSLTHTSTVNRAASDTLLVLVCVCVSVRAHTHHTPAL